MANTELFVPYLKEVIKGKSNKYYENLQTVQVKKSLNEDPKSRRLKKKQPQDLKKPLGVHFDC